jgi:hypothetical protein
VRPKIVMLPLIGAILLGASCELCQVQPPAAVITGDNSGGIIAIYQIWEASDSYGRVYVQKISPEGGVLWGGEGVFIGSGCRASDRCESYAVSGGSGGAIVIWVERLPEPTGESQLSYFQTHVAKIDSEGNIEWRSDIPGVYQAIPDGSGGAIIAFNDDHDNLFVLKIDAEGNFAWGEGGVSLNMSGYDPQRDISSDNLGGVIAVQRIPKEGTVRAQRVDSEGKILWQPGGER